MRLLSLCNILSDVRISLSFTIAVGPLANAVILRSGSRAGLMTFYCFRFQIPPTWRDRSPYLYPPGTGWPSYTPRHWVPFRRLLWLAGLRWRYSSAPPHGSIIHTLRRFTFITFPCSLCRLYVKDSQHATRYGLRRRSQPERHRLAICIMQRFHTRTLILLSTHICSDTQSLAISLESCFKQHQTPEFMQVMDICDLSSSAEGYKKTKFRGRSPQAKYTDRATAACRRS
jgi:hypothetical protein